MQVMDSKVAMAIINLALFAMLGNVSHVSSDLTLDIIIVDLSTPNGNMDVICYARTDTLLALGKMRTDAFICIDVDALSSVLFLLDYINQNSVIDTGIESTRGDLNLSSDHYSGTHGISTSVNGLSYVGYSRCSTIVSAPVVSTLLVAIYYRDHNHYYFTTDFVISVLILDIKLDNMRGKLFRLINNVSIILGKVKHIMDNDIL